LLSPPFCRRRLFPEEWFNFFISLVNHLSLLSEFSGEALKKIHGQITPVIMRHQVDLKMKSADTPRGCRAVLRGGGQTRERFSQGSRTACTYSDCQKFFPIGGIKKFTIKISKN